VVLEGDPGGGVRLPELMAELGKRDVQSVLVEGGPTLAWSLVRDDAVEKVVVYIAPVLVGGERASSLLAGEGFAPIGEARRLEVSSVEQVGEDLKVEAYVHRDR
jgi:diaminohydroxyphosphoribosylaminopyrimidine deaminase/5-amino-6-(5-phosphoribosylamino)uracil reductase